MQVVISFFVGNDPLSHLPVKAKAKGVWSSLLYNVYSLLTRFELHVVIICGEPTVTGALFNTLGLYGLRPPPVRKLLTAATLSTHQTAVAPKAHTSAPLNGLITQQQFSTIFHIFNVVRVVFHTVRGQLLVEVLWFLRKWNLFNIIYMPITITL